MVTILDGKKISEQIKKELRKEVLKLRKKRIIPTLAFFVTPDTVGETYVRIKERMAKEVGIDTLHGNLKKPTTEGIIKIVKGWNSNKKIHGIVIQLPLPQTIDTFKVLDSIIPAKDVDGLGKEQQVLLYRGYPKTVFGQRQSLKQFYPATPLGVLALLERYRISVAGKHVVVVGRSLLVGKPLALLLLKENATVTVAHSKTNKLGEITRQADILISAVGKPNLIKADMVKKGAAVIDVGITIAPAPSGKGQTLLGDVDFENVKKVASYISPVPGGVGPMTVAMLIKNVIESAKRVT